MSMNRTVKKKDVQIDGLYVAKISGKLTVVKIVNRLYPPDDRELKKVVGWNAINLWTGKIVRIKSAQKLRLDLSWGSMFAGAIYSTYQSGRYKVEEPKFAKIGLPALDLLLQATNKSEEQ